MFVLSRFWQSTIGKKVVMAVTGIIGILFVIGHMLGNLTMFKGQEAMYHYALLLHREPIDRQHFPLALPLAGPGGNADRDGGYPAVG